jgi:hypothetical protein
MVAPAKPEKMRTSTPLKTHHGAQFHFCVGAKGGAGQAGRGAGWAGEGSVGHGWGGGHMVRTHRVEVGCVRGVQAVSRGPRVAMQAVDKQGAETEAWAGLDRKERKSGCRSRARGRGFVGKVGLGWGRGRGGGTDLEEAVRLHHRALAVGALPEPPHHRDRRQYEPDVRDGQRRVQRVEGTVEGREKREEPDERACA